jgi:hypothetical protein
MTPQTAARATSAFLDTDTRIDAPTVRAGSLEVGVPAATVPVMEKAQEKRLAMNEALFRDVNERIREISDSFGQRDETYDFLCECSDPECRERVVLTRAEYEHVRSESTRFVVAKGHAMPEIESVVQQAQDHVIVEKEGVAADVAIHLDKPAD